MKHIGPEALLTLHSWLAEVGLRLQEPNLTHVVHHVEWLLETNRDLNLTAVSDVTGALRLHVLDSLLAVPEVLDAPSGLLLDIGTGGGFPGLELGLVSGRHALLVDSVQKKSNALGAFLLHESLDSRISVSAERTELLAQHSPQIAAVVTARAVAELPVLAELAAPLLMQGGRLVALKGRLEEEEYRRGLEAGAICGLSPLTIRRMTLPAGSEARTIVVFEKTGSSKVSLPRRPGMAAKRPLA